MVGDLQPRLDGNQGVDFVPKVIKEKDRVLNTFGFDNSESPLDLKVEGNDLLLPKEEYAMVNEVPGEEGVWESEIETLDIEKSEVIAGDDRQDWDRDRDRDRDREGEAQHMPSSPKRVIEKTSVQREFATPSIDRSQLLRDIRDAALALKQANQSSMRISLDEGVFGKGHLQVSLENSQVAIDLSEVSSELKTLIYGEFESLRVRLAEHDLVLVHPSKENHGRQQSTFDEGNDERRRQFQEVMPAPFSGPTPRELKSLWQQPLSKALNQGSLSLRV
jgi:hypothetical protein